LDVRDLVSSVLHACKSPVTSDSFLTVAVQQAGQAPSLKYLSKRNPFRPVKSTTSLLEVAILLRERTVHRVPVVGEDGVCVAIVSQSTILKFLSDHRDQTAHDVGQTLAATHLGIKSVFTIEDTKTARDAFSMIDKTGLSGIGVVDSEGHLVGNTSARDIKYFVLDKGQLSMDEAVMDYLATIRQRQISEKDRAPVSSIHRTDTLGRAIGLLGKTQYHRLFLVDDQRKPIGVVSVADILSFATRETKEHKEKEKEKPKEKPKDPGHEKEKPAAHGASS